MERGVSIDPVPSSFDVVPQQGTAAAKYPERLAIMFQVPAPPMD